MTGRLVHALDTVLDRTVVGGYTQIGYRLRSRGWPVGDPAPGALGGKVAVVTGGGSGLGKATALGLAALGASVHLAVRNPDRAEDAADEIRRTVPGADVLVRRCDVSDLGSVRAFAEGLRAAVQRVDVLVHNAGTLPAQRQETADGHELTLATHVLGPVLMTELLRPLLARAGRSRVVVVSSGGMYTASLPADDPEFRTGTYAGAKAYARTKRMQVDLTPMMQRRWGADGIAVHTMHPGWVDTPGIVTSLPAFHTVMGPVLRDARAGADTIVWLAATEPPPPGGRFWQDRAPRPEHYLRSTRASPAEVAKVWAYVLDADGLSGGSPAPG